MRTIKTSVVLFLLMTVLLGLVYPVFAWGIAHLLFPSQSEGSLVYNNEVLPVGSSLIAQNFTNDNYFWPRPSQTPLKPYNAQASGNWQLSLSNPKLAEAVKEQASKFRDISRSSARLPMDIVTSSASGLDPHISPQAAHLQTERIAKARNMSTQHVLRLIQSTIEQPTFGFLGEARVNVLRLNLLLDQESGLSHD